MRWAIAFAALMAIVAIGCSLATDASAQDDVTATAVQSIGQLNHQDRATLLESVKGATDGIQFALQAAVGGDTGKMLKGIGDALAVLPGGFGYAGVAFSLAASAVTLFGGHGEKQDPILSALSSFQCQFHNEMAAIQTTLQDMNAKISSIIVNIDQILSDISEIPAKVVAEMKMTDIVVMKDKFASVQRSATQYIQGNLTRAQMISKCEDFDVAALFSELETILKDEKDLFGAKFEVQDTANGKSQTQLLIFYLSVIPLVSNCNSLRYSVASIRDDGARMHDVIQLVLQRAAWYLTVPDRTVYIKETFNPFGTLIDVGEYRETNGYRLSLVFKTYSIVPPHGVCYKVSSDGVYLSTIKLDIRQRVPTDTVFCVKSVATTDSPNRIVYAERDDSNASIFQPEVNGNFDALGDRGWRKNSISFYTSKIGCWQRLPRLTVASDFVIFQANSTNVSLDDLTGICQSLGDGYDRDGDGHSKDYKGAPWTLFCLRYVKRSLREIDEHSGKFLTGVQFNEMDAGKAWLAACPDDGYVRDKYNVTVPSQISHSWLGGTSTVKSYAVCLKWEQFVAGTTASHFLKRVWIDDSADMHNKPKQERNIGEQPLELQLAPSQVDLQNF